MDTESQDHLVLGEIYREHGQELTDDIWKRCIGVSIKLFDPLKHLQTLTAQELDYDELRKRYRERILKLLEHEQPLPGVVDYLKRAKELGLKLGVATSSPRDWVTLHLTHTGLIDTFDCIFTASEVERVKPEPDLYLRAVEALGVEPHEAIAFEDTPTGTLAAKRAGLYCVSIPGEVTKHLEFTPHDLSLESLAQMTLDELIAKLTEQGGPSVE